MRDDSNFDEAAKLIDAFALQLLKLSAGKAIPRRWKNHLLRAIAKTTPGKPGKKVNYAQVVEVVKRLALVGDEVRKGRTKNHNPAIYKDEIAKDIGISRKTVERIDKKRPHYISDLSQLETLDPKVRKSQIDGMAAAICEQLEKEDEEEERVRKSRASRRHTQLLAEWDSPRNESDRGE